MNKNREIYYHLAGQLSDFQTTFNGNGGQAPLPNAMPPADDSPAPTPITWKERRNLMKKKIYQTGAEVPVVDDDVNNPQRDIGFIQ